MSRLAPSQFQIEKLEGLDTARFPRFENKLREAALSPLRPHSVSTLQMNLGKMCNQTCAHCHVDAGPTHREVMSKEVMQDCLRVITEAKISRVDLTGGAPEMNPHFRWFVAEVRNLGVEVLVRCNLTIILANQKYHDLPTFFKEHNVEVISSLPHYSSLRTNRQRGDGVFEKSIKALKLLNNVGYGKEGTGLKLNLVCNPTGRFLPGNQRSLEKDFKAKLKRDFDIDFNNLFCITNMPISRFLEYLLNTENFEEYMETLVKAYNPEAAQAVMCRDLVSVGWDGKLYDCDFNQMLDMQLQDDIGNIKTFTLDRALKRSILLGQHCYGCTAGSGSSCGGTTAG